MVLDDDGSGLSAVDPHRGYSQRASKHGGFKKQWLNNHVTWNFINLEISNKLQVPDAPNSGIFFLQGTDLPLENTKSQLRWFP